MERKRALSLLRAVSTNEEGAASLLAAVPAEAWHDVLRQLQLLELTPYFYSHLVRSPAADHVPAEVLHRLQETYFLHAARNALILEDLREIIGILRLHDIDAIVLKGACLAETVYDDIALRPMHDIDILVREEYLWVVQVVLIGAGYGPLMRPPVEEQLLRHHHLIPFTRPGGPSVEVHAALTPSGGRCAMAMDGFWDRARCAAFGGQTALILSPEDLLLHLCLHFSVNHRFSILEMKNLCDIGEIIRRYNPAIDWKTLGDRARGYGIGRYVYCTLRMAAILFGADLRSEDLHRIGHDDSDTRMADMVADLLLDETSILLPDAVEHMDKENGLASKALVLARSVVPPRLYLARKYGVEDTPAPRSLYLRHWMEGLIRAGEFLAHLLCWSRKARAAITRRRATILINNWLRSGSALSLGPKGRET